MWVHGAAPFVRGVELHRMRVRKGLLVVVGLVVLLVVGFFAASIHRNHQLGQRLVDDVAALRARKHVLLRPEGAPPPAVENGSVCLASTLGVAPYDLSPFSNRSGDVKEFVDGKKPLTELSQDLRDRLDTLRPWVAAVRACGDAATVSIAPNAEPWSVNVPALKLSSAGRHTALDVRIMLHDQRVGEALEACTATMEVALNGSRESVMNAMTASAVVKTLAGVCAEAWSLADGPTRKHFGGRWVLLGTRFGSEREVFESERVTMSLMLFLPYASEDARAKLPANPMPVELPPVQRLYLGRVWSNWDAAMRKVVEANDDASRAAAKQALRDTRPWWLPVEAWLLDFDSSQFHERMEFQRALLNTLASFATNGSTPLPSSVTSDETTVTLTDVDGAKLVLTRPR